MPDAAAQGLGQRTRRVGLDPRAGLTSGAGAARIYENAAGTPTGWEETSELRTDNPIYADDFGDAAALADGDVVVGANLSSAGAGNVYTFDVTEHMSRYCLCDAGAPCANEDSGAGCENSTGGGALLTACGPTSVRADALTMVLSGLPSGQFGTVYAGSQATVIPFGDGQRCVGQVILRYPVHAGGDAGTIVQTAIVSFGGFTSGVTGYFQGWYRDPAGSCASGFNFTSALEVQFAP